MTAIANLVADPAWWFTAVFVGLLISIAAGFSQIWLTRLWGNYSTTQRAKNVKHKAQVEQWALLCVAYPSYFQANNAMMTFFAAMSILFGVVFSTAIVGGAALALYPPATLSQSGARLVVTILTVVGFMSIVVWLTSFNYAFRRAEIAMRAEAIMDANMRAQAPPPAP